MLLCMNLRQFWMLRIAICKHIEYPAWGKKIQLDDGLWRRIYYKQSQRNTMIYVVNGNKRFNASTIWNNETRKFHLSRNLVKRWYSFVILNRFDVNLRVHSFQTGSESKKRDFDFCFFAYGMNSISEKYKYCRFIVHDCSLLGIVKRVPLREWRKTLNPSMIHSIDSIALYDLSRHCGFCRRKNIKNNRTKLTFCTNVKPV